MCLGCSDGSPSSRLVRLKLKFQKPRLRSGLFCAQITGKILRFKKRDRLNNLDIKDFKRDRLNNLDIKILKRDRLSNLDIRHIVCILYVDEDATYESQRV